MNVEELTKEIYNKYPKVWGKICLKDGDLLHDDTSQQIFVSFFPPDLFIGDQYESRLPFKMLYGLLDEFFRENDIYIIQFLYDLGQNYLFLNSKEDMKKNNVYEKFQAQAILKACEMLNNKLK